jgi:hypothetical protein
MASETRVRVRGSTLSLPFETRETVWVETPASLATSAIDGPRRGRSGMEAAAIGAGLLFVVKASNLLDLVILLAVVT